MQPRGLQFMELENKVLVLKPLSIKTSGCGPFLSPGLCVQEVWGFAPVASGEAFKKIVSCPLSHRLGISSPSH